MHPLTWQDKLRETKVAARNTPGLHVEFSASPAGATDAFIAHVVRRFPFVSEEYLDFLRLTDGAQIEMCVFFGSEDSRQGSLFHAASRWRNIIDLHGGLPVGEDAGGACFVLNTQGAIRLVENDPPTSENGVLLAASLGEFFGDILMGPRFPALYGKQSLSQLANAWTKYLGDRGWA